MSRARLGLYIFGRTSLFQNCFELTPTFNQLLARPLQLHIAPEEAYPVKRKVRTCCLLYSVERKFRTCCVLYPFKRKLRTRSVLYPFKRKVRRNSEFIQVKPDSNLNTTTNFVV